MIMKNFRFKKYNLVAALFLIIAYTKAIAANDLTSIAIVIPFESQAGTIDNMTGIKAIKPEIVSEKDGNGLTVKRKYYHNQPLKYHISLCIVYPKNGSFTKQDIQFVIDAAEESVKKHLIVDKGGVNRVQLFTPLKDLNSKKAIDRSTFKDNETAKDVFNILKGQNGKTSITDGYITLEISTNGVLADVANSLRKKLEKNPNFKLPDYEFKSHITLDHITRCEDRAGNGQFKPINFKSEKSISKITDEFNLITRNVIKEKKKSQSGISLKICEVEVSGRDTKHKDHTITKMIQKNGKWSEMK